MAVKREAYLYLSAALRARETKLLSTERAERMLDAPGYEECAKLLTDCGYPDLSQMNAEGIERELSAHRAAVLDELDRLAPDSSIVDVFRMKYDCHNLKAVIKSGAVGADAERLLSSCGRIRPEKLLAAVQDERLSELPPVLAKAAEDAASALARTGNPQLADFILDKAYFAELSAAAENSGSSFLKGYAAVLADSTNLRSVVRTLRMGKSSDYLRDALVPGGSIDTDRLMNADKDSLPALYTRSVLETAAALGAEAAQGGTLTAFELACDNAVNTYLKGAKLVSFGEEPLVAYIAAVEGEITAVRMILTGRLAGIAPAVIRERLRELYA